MQKPNSSIFSFFSFPPLFNYWTTKLVHQRGDTSLIYKEIKIPRKPINITIFSPPIITLTYKIYSNWQSYSFSLASILFRLWFLVLSTTPFMASSDAMNFHSFTHFFLCFFFFFPFLVFTFFNLWTLTGNLNHKNSRKYYAILMLNLLRHLAHKYSMQLIITHITCGTFHVKRRTGNLGGWHEAVSASSLQPARGLLIYAHLLHFVSTLILWIYRMPFQK